MDQQAWLLGPYPMEREVVSFIDKEGTVCIPAPEKFVYILNDVGPKLKNTQLDPKPPARRCQDRDTSKPTDLNIIDNE